MSENKYYSLFLDDERMPKDVTWIELPLVAWVIVRNYNDFVRVIEQNGVPQIVSFDHDIGIEHYQEYNRAHNSDKKIRYETFTEKTGFDCAKWLANYCVDKNLPVPVYYLHTMNGIGALNIQSILESARKVISGSKL
jgi:hypothetical protein